MLSAPTYGSTDRAHCLDCKRPTTFRWCGKQNHTVPRVNMWRCATCGHERMQMADVTDGENLCRSILNSHLRKKGVTMPQAEYQDALALVQSELWDLWLRWDPTRGVRFTAYATGLLRLRVNNHWRQDLGRDVQKAHVGALSLDAPFEDGSELGGIVAASTGDLGLDRGASLMRTVASGSGGTVQSLEAVYPELAAARRRVGGVDRKPHA